MRNTLRNAIAFVGIAVPATLSVLWLRADDAGTATYFAATELRTGNGRFLPAELMGNSDYCGHCHTDIFHEWNASMHHFSSFNNPIYRNVALSTLERRGGEVLKQCAACHDPLPLAAGEVPAADHNRWSWNAGITCLACHRITDVHGGNGAYTLSAPVLHPFALSDHPWLQALHRRLLSWFPRLHRAVLAKPLHGTAEYCAACHTVVATAATNGEEDLLLQNEYSSWHASRFAHRDLAADYRTCVDCHMPQVPSNDPAARDGLVRSHRFAGGNTLLPHMNRDHEQLLATQSFLQSRAVTLRCKSIRGTGGVSASCEDYRVVPGESLEVAFAIANQGVGHDFPGGTNDSNQVWLEIAVTDAAGIVLLRSGALGANGDPDGSAYALRTEYANADGEPVDRLTASSDAAVRVRSNVLAPGEERTVTYRVQLRRDTPLPLSISARLNWRKFSAAFLRKVLGDSSPGEIPLTVMDQTTITLQGR